MKHGNQKQIYEDTGNEDFVLDALSNLAKRQNRRRYFKKSLIICCIVFALCVCLGAFIYINSNIGLKSFLSDSLPFAGAFKDSVRSLLKLFALLCFPLILMFSLGFTLFSPYISLPIVGIIGGISGFCAMYFSTNIFSSPSAKFTAYYIVYIIICIVYCVVNICMASVSMSFCSALKHNTKTRSKIDSDDTSEYFTFFTNCTSLILLLLLFRCAGMYMIAIFK